MTLEKDPKKLDLANYELNYDVDPLFKIVTSKFGDSRTTNSLLQNLLPIEASTFDYILEEKLKNINEDNKESKKNKKNSIGETQINIFEIKSNCFIHKFIYIIT